MRTYNQRQAEQRMNELASEGKEFVFVISYDMQHSYIEEVGSVNDQEMLYAFPHINNLPEGESPAATPVRWTFDAPDRAKYERSINHVKQNQCRRNCYLANLTCRVPVETNLTMREIFLRSEAKYRCWMKNRFVCFSPEIFVRVANGKISSFPMKRNYRRYAPQCRGNTDEQLERGGGTRYYSGPYTQRLEYGG